MNAKMELNAYLLVYNMNANAIVAILENTVKIVKKSFFILKCYLLK